MFHPLPKLPDGRPPVVMHGQGFKPGVHDGIDLVYIKHPGEPVDLPTTGTYYCFPVGIPVMSMAGGIVEYAKWAANGWRVKVRHSDGRYQSHYLHLASISVITGQVVEAGTPLGLAGYDPTKQTGDPRTNNIRHLHLGVFLDGEYVDPAPLLGYPSSLQSGGGLALLVGIGLILWRLAK